jgi:hypothetical protein
MFRFNLKFLAGLAVLVCLTFSFTLQQAQADAPQNSNVFAPLEGRGENTNPPPEPQPIEGAFFVQADTKTGSAAIAVDNQGGKHLAYRYYLPDDQHPSAVYLYCPGQSANCAEPANWTGLYMADYVNEVQLDLTPGGQPRLLIRLTSTHYANANDLYYAACDQNCTDANNWSLTYLTSTSGMAAHETEDITTPQRSFALDPQGRPRFVYLDKNTANAEPDHLGTFYAFCDRQCTDRANWYEAKISWGENPFYEHFYYPSLAFTDLGQPRVVGDGLYLVDGQELGIYYLACDTNCGDSNSWQRVRLFERGSGANVSWDLEMNGYQPRLAFYEGAQLGGGGDILYYAWCNDDCFNAAGWQRHDLGLGAMNGKHPDLELDGEGRPRLAYAVENGGGIGYAWCNDNCESTEGQWQQQIVDTATKLEEEYPMARPSQCDAGLWDSMTPVLALDWAGNPHLAYDAAYNTRCWYDDNPDDDQPAVLNFWQLWHSVRVTYFPQPPQL